MDHTEASVPPAAHHWHACVCIWFHVFGLTPLCQTKAFEERLEHQKVNVAKSFKLDGNITGDLSRRGLASAWWFTHYL